MTINDRQKLISELFEDCRKILLAKGADYAGNNDSLANFKRNAERLSLESDIANLAWAAGFFDGEGCTIIGRAKRRNRTHLVPFISVAQKDRRVLDKFANIFSLRVRGPYTHHYQGGRTSLAYSCKIGGTRQCLDLLKKMWPFLGDVKREQAISVFKAVQDDRDKYKKDFRSKIVPNLANLDKERAYKVTKYQVWQIFFAKHVDAIFSAIKKSPNFPQAESEPMRGRIQDAINYLGILEALMEEDWQANRQTSNPA